MTITFKCPKCGGLCAFADKHAGKRAKCVKCRQGFSIPLKNGETAIKIKTKKVQERPLPGFYRAVFIDNWKVFAGKVNILPWVFILAMANCNFFVASVLLRAAVWGALMWYYMEIVCVAGFGVDALPEFFAESGFEFVWNIIKSLYIFFVTLLLVELPFAVVIWILQKAGFNWVPLRAVLALAGLFFFPAAILNVSVRQDILALLRTDCIIKPVVKAFRPYLLTAGIVILAVVVEFCFANYSGLKDKGTVVKGLHFIGSMAAAVIMVMAARSVGLFFRHYGCYCIEDKTKEPII